MQVWLYVDPACGWSQVAVRWLEAVRCGRRIDLRLLPYSLLLRDGRDGYPPPVVARREAALRVLRVLAGLGADPDGGLAFWNAVVQQDGQTPFGDVAGAAALAGVSGWTAAADDQAVDVELLKQMAAADALAGGAATLPMLVLADQVAFTGPLLREPLTVEAAVALWDSVVSAARTPGFYELSRRRPPHPAIAGLPEVPEPPTLPADDRPSPLGQLVRGYVERVVNQRDLSAVDDLVAADYTGGGYGWPPDLDRLRAFYADQMRDRPDWSISIQETVESGDVVVVRACAGGTVNVDGRALRRDLEWLASYRVVNGRISEIRVLSLTPRHRGPSY
jgi:ketosteroid isomerase-like protein